MTKLRPIPSETLRHWARCFRDKTLHDEYGRELAALLFYLAENLDFYDRMEAVTNAPSVQVRQ